MLRLHASGSSAYAMAVVGSWFVVDMRDASACGGCFHPPPRPQEVDTSVVTDHRMAFAMSGAQTVLWDQIRYSGNPIDFAWVLPVRAGARIELSHDAWIAALDASTQTVISGPAPSCGGAAPTSYSGGGCGFMGSSESVPAGSAAVLVDAGQGQVQVISHQVVGPYDAVTVRSSQGEALGDWLRANGYDVPPSIQPTVDAYSTAGFDFIALKLAPSQGVQAMQPVRVVTPGAAPTLPLRMVAAGVGAHVGLELYVLSEGRYHPANFPDIAIDFTKLAWDPIASRSNYAELSQQALAGNGGTGWLIESSQPANLFGYGGTNPGLALAYETTCRTLTFIPPCGVPTTDAGSNGTAGSDEAGSIADAGSGKSGEAGDDGGATMIAPEADAATPVVVCGQTIVTSCDDLSLAMTGIAAGNLWVTRMRADFPVTALASDVVLEASASQESVPNTHHTDTYTIANYDPCSPAPKGAGASASSDAGSSGHSSVAPIGAAALLLSLRRRRIRAGRRGVGRG